MDRNQFIQNFATASPELNKERMDEIIDNSLRELDGNRPGIKNLIIVMEEFMEAGQEVSKFIRGNGNITGLTEELADAYLSIRYVQKICNISDEKLTKAINVKLDRQNERNRIE